jgi:hypothetical protein
VTRYDRCPVCGSLLLCAAIGYRGFHFDWRACGRDECGYMAKAKPHRRLCDMAAKAKKARARK